MRYFLVFMVAMIHCRGLATTWDEPWRKEIIKEAEAFVLAKVLSCSDTLMKIQIEKTLGGQASGTILVDDFYMLDLCSFSGGHGPEFHFNPEAKYYFLLKKGENGNYQMSTPTSGFDPLSQDGENQVTATFRHSYHKSMIDQELYEKIYVELWKGLHGEIFDKAYLLEFISTQLTFPPAGFDEDEIETFFTQHAAMEVVYMLGIETNFKSLKPFCETDNFHANVSAIRAMQFVKYNERDLVSSYLLRFLKSEEMDNFTKVIAIWTLWEIGGENVRLQLIKNSDNFSDERSGFEGNIMDPRVCTHFPSPRGAVTELRKS